MRKFAGVFIVCVCAATAMAADFTGTWKLNLQKSKLNHSNIASETMTIEQTGPNSYRTSQDVTLTSGGKRHGAINRVYDGKEHPVAAADSTGHESEICESVDRGRRITMKKDGKVVTIINSSVSADGQTLTNKRSNADGEEEVMIFDREK